MSWLTRFVNVLRANRVSRDIDREIQSHLAERSDELERAGMSHDDAMSEARRRFGNLGQQKETTRGRDVFMWLDTLLADIRYAARGLRRSPVFATVAVLSLALGIGANTAIFTLINTVMLSSLPVSHPEQLYDVSVPEGLGKGARITRPLWEQIRDRQDVFSSVFTYGATNVSVGAAADARNLSLGTVSGDLFAALGVRPAAGRLISQADDVRGCAATAVITHAFWQSEFGGAADAIGRTISLDGAPFQIVGVTEPKFVGIEVGYSVPLWAPACAEPIIRAASGGTRGNFGIGWIIGRAKPDVTLAQMRARITALAPAVLAAAAPPNPAEAAEYRKLTLTVTPFAKGIPGLGATYSDALRLLMLVVGVVLLIACANVANLLLARSATRQREIAVRLAIGASRARIVRQLLTESVLLASFGAIAGAFFAIWGSRALAAFLWTAPRTASLQLTPDVRVLAFTIAIAAVSGILFGLAPVWRARRVDPQTAMRASSRGIAEGHSRFGIGKSLVATQLALSLVAVAAAGLLLGSWRRLDGADTGFRRENVTVVTANVRAAGLSGEQRALAFRQMTERLRTTPGIEAAASATLVPFGRVNSGITVDVTGYTPASQRDAFARVNLVSPGYFATLGIRLTAGRDFDAGDVPESRPVAIVNEEFARRYYGGASAVGQQFRVQLRDGPGDPIDIVGVAADTRENDMREPIQPMVYYAESQDTQAGMNLRYVLRTSPSAPDVAPLVTRAITDVEPRATVAITTLDDQIANSLRHPRTVGVLAGIFGALALLLASIGLYGIMSYTVARRRNEIGVRIALGAARSRIVRMVLNETGRLVAIGTLFGVVLTLAGTRFVRTLVYGAEPNDPATLAISAGTLVCVAIGAAMLPAWRASRADPVSALRED